VKDTTLVVAGMATLSAGTYAFRLSGQALRARISLPPRVTRLLEAAAVLLLAPLVATTALTEGHGFAGLARPEDRGEGVPGWRGPRFPRNERIGRNDRWGRAPEGMAQARGGEQPAPEPGTQSEDERPQVEDTERQAAQITSAEPVTRFPSVEQEETPAAFTTEQPFVVEQEGSESPADTAEASETEGPARRPARSRSPRGPGRRRGTGAPDAAAVDGGDQPAAQTDEPPWPPDQTQQEHV